MYLHAHYFDTYRNPIIVHSTFLQIYSTSNYFSYEYVQNNKKKIILISGIKI
jgi:hypothetical protein